MSVLKTLLAGSALVCLSSAAYADDGGHRDEGKAWSSTANGSYAVAQLNDTRVAEAMTTAKPVPAGVVIFIHRGTLYLTQPYGDQTYGDYTY